MRKQKRGEKKKKRSDFYEKKRFKEDIRVEKTKGVKTRVEDEEITSEEDYVESEEDK